MLDYLLNLKFVELESYLKSTFNTSNESISTEIDSTPSAKKIKLNEKPIQTINQSEEIKDVTLCYSKFYKYTNINKIIKDNANNTINDIKYKWKFDTKKCVDATPLLIVKNNSVLILIMVPGALLEL